MNTILVKAYAGLAILIVILGVLVFVPAGTMSYWQGWVYLALFFLCCLIITLYLMRSDMDLLQRRLTAGPGGETQRSQKIIQFIAQFAFISIYVLSGLDRRFGWSEVPSWSSITADAGCVAGFYIVFLTFRENSFTSATINVGEGQKVIGTGPYAIIRHPMYSGALLLLFCTPIALGSWWALLSFIPMCAIIVARLLYEEQFLKTNLEGYTAYCSRVRSRLLPGVF